MTATGTPGTSAEDARTAAEIREEPGTALRICPLCEATCGLTVTVEDGNTLIHGQIVDQAALFGVLQKLRDLALPLISVELDAQGTATPPPG